MTGECVDLIRFLQLVEKESECPEARHWAEVTTETLLVRIIHFSQILDEVSPDIRQDYCRVLEEILPLMPPWVTLEVTNATYDKLQEVLPPTLWENISGHLTDWDSVSSVDI